MLGGGPVERAFEQHAQRRAAGTPVPTVLIGSEVTATWTRTAGNVVRSTARTPEDAARTYLHHADVRAMLETTLSARVIAARATQGMAKDRTAFERDVWLGVSRDALVAAGDLDGQRLLGSVFGREVPREPLRALAAARRVLGPEAPPLLIELPAAEIDVAVRVTIALAEAVPPMSLALTTSSDAWAAWLSTSGREHAKAMVRPFVVETPRVVPPPSDVAAVRALVDRARESTNPKDDDEARSAAERLLFDALEAAPRSEGLFALNRCLDVKFGPRALEIDLVAMTSKLAVEIDGYFHFRHPDGYRRDRRKDIALQREGFFVLRFLAEDVVARLDEVVSTIHDTLTFLERATP